MSDIFCTKYIKDLPLELIKEMGLLSAADRKILSLYEEGERGITEILVAYFRKFNEIKTRQHMMTVLYRLHRKKGLIEPTKHKGHYILTDFGKETLEATKRGGGDE